MRLTFTTWPAKTKIQYGASEKFGPEIKQQIEEQTVPLQNGQEILKNTRLVKAANFMIDDTWIPEAKAFRYTSCPGTSAAPGLNFLIGEGIAYAWRQTKDARLRRVSLDAIETIVARMDGMGKNISMELRSTPRQLFDITQMLQIQDPISASAKIPAAGKGNEVQFSADAKTVKGKVEEYSWDFGDGIKGAGETVSHAYPNGGAYRVKLTARNSAGETATNTIGISVPPPFLQQLDTTRDVIIQAEDFSSQGLDKVSIVEGRVGAIGKAITQWEATQGHWVEWKFDAPANATYEIVLKYATASPEAKRSLEIDGQTPAGLEAGSTSARHRRIQRERGQLENVAGSDKRSKAIARAAFQRRAHAASGERGRRPGAGFYSGEKSGFLKQGK